MVKDKISKMRKWTYQQKRVRRHFMFKKWLMEDNQLWYYGLSNFIIKTKYK